jgi:hypothetical protein
MTRLINEEGRLGTNVVEEEEEDEWMRENEVSHLESVTVEIILKVFKLKLTVMKENREK